jgi:MarC family membrane protein
MDPVGNIPIFIALLRPYHKGRRYWIILRESLIGFVILVLFLFFGQYILTALGVTESALGIAGGIVLFIISIRMIFPGDKERKLDEISTEPFIVPLAIPLYAGPSAMAIVLLLSSHQPELMGVWFLVILTASTIFTLLMLSATWLMRWLGERTIIAMERLTGMLLNVIAVQMLLNGINQYFHLQH